MTRLWKRVLLSTRKYTRQEQNVESKTACPDFIIIKGNNDNDNNNYDKVVKLQLR
jgi:hypothetical protein